MEKFSVGPFLSSSCIAALVQLQVPLVGVPLATPVTDELLATGVNVPLMGPQVASLAEGFAADVADIWFLSRVNAQVKLKAVGIVECFVTGFALERPVHGVRATVGDQAALLAERLAALLAAERPLACVDAEMDLQVHRLSERLPTEVTTIGPQVTVDPLVVLQVNRMAESFGALLALKWLLASVDKLV